MTTEYSIDNGASWHVAVPGQVVNIPEGLAIFTRPRIASQPDVASIEDDAIEAAALKHVATSWGTLPVAAYRSGDYKQTEQFRRLKAFALELLDSRAPADQAASVAPWGLTFHGYSDDDEHTGETILDYMRSRGEVGTDDLKVGDVLDVTAIWTQDQKWRVTCEGNPFEVERISPAAQSADKP